MVTDILLKRRNLQADPKYFFRVTSKCSVTSIVKSGKITYFCLKHPFQFSYYSQFFSLIYSSFQIDILSVPNWHSQCSKISFMWFHLHSLISTHAYMLHLPHSLLIQLLSFLQGQVQIFPPEGRCSIVSQFLHVLLAIVSLIFIPLY